MTHFSRLSSIVWRGALCAGLITGTANAPAFAFDLGYHNDLSYAAMAGFRSEVRELVAVENMYTDLRTVVSIRTPPFLKRIHFDDRFRYFAHKTQWGITMSLLAPSFTCNPANTDHLYDLAERIGMTHHSVQDYYAHSNHVEMVSRMGGTPPVTFNDVETLPAWAQLLGIWQADVAADEGEALISGAYSVLPPPIFDPQGVQMNLHHAILNKDKPVVAGGYLYASIMSRTAMHRNAMISARRNSFDVLAKASQSFPGCYAALRTYRMGLWERGRLKLRKIAAVIAAKVAGHWRSGEPTVSGDMVDVTISMPPVYPMEGKPDDKKVAPFSYVIINRGKEAVETITLRAFEGFALEGMEVAEKGYKASRTDDDTVVIEGTPLAPGASVTVTLIPASRYEIAHVTLLTGEGRGVDLIGPGVPSYETAIMARIIARAEGMDPEKMYEEFGVPKDRRSLPVAEMRAAEKRK